MEKWMFEKVQNDSAPPPLRQPDNKMNGCFQYNGCLLTLVICEIKSNLFHTLFDLPVLLYSYPDGDGLMPFKQVWYFAQNFIQTDVLLCSRLYTA